MRSPVTSPLSSSHLPTSLFQSMPTTANTDLLTRPPYSLPPPPAMLPAPPTLSKARHLSTSPTPPQRALTSPKPWQHRLVFTSSSSSLLPRHHCLLEIASLTSNDADEIQPSPMPPVTRRCQIFLSTSIRTPRRHPRHHHCIKSPLPSLKKLADLIIAFALTRQPAKHHHR